MWLLHLMSRCCNTKSAMHRTTMQLQLLALVVFWLSRSKILADEERITSSDDDLIVSKSGSACAEDGEAAAEENCSGLMQDAADNKDAFIYPTATAVAAAVPPPPASTASITRKPMPFATRLEAAETGHTMTIPPQRTDAVVSVRQSDRKLTTTPPSPHHPPPPPSPCAPSATAAGDKDCTAASLSPTSTEAASASGPGRDKMLTSDLPSHPESKRDRVRERKNSPFPPTSQPPAAKASAKASQTIVGVNQTVGLNKDQTDGTKEKKPPLEGATLHNNDDNGVDSSSYSSSLSVTGSTITTSGVSQTTLLHDNRDHLLSLYINPQTLLIVAITGGGLAILLLLLIIAVCRCNSRGRRPKNPSTIASGKTDRGKSYPYEACNTLPPRPPVPSPASCHGTLPLTPDFYLVKNSVVTSSISSSSCQHHPHLSSAHSQRPVALVSTSGAASIDPVMFKTTAKKDVKEWYV